MCLWREKEPTKNKFFGNPAIVASDTGLRSSVLRLQLSLNLPFRNMSDLFRCLACTNRPRHAVDKSNLSSYSIQHHSTYACQVLPVMLLPSISQVGAQTVTNTIARTPIICRFGCNQRRLPKLGDTNPWSHLRLPRGSPPPSRRQARMRQASREPADHEADRELTRSHHCLP